MENSLQQEIDNLNLFAVNITNDVTKFSKENTHDLSNFSQGISNDLSNFSQGITNDVKNFSETITKDVNNLEDIVTNNKQKFDWVDNKVKYLSKLICPFNFNTDKLVAAINPLKKAMYIVNYTIDLINTNFIDIQNNNSYSQVLTPFFNNSFLDPLTSYVTIKPIPLLPLYEEYLEEAKYVFVWKKDNDLTDDYILKNNDPILKSQYTEEINVFNSFYETNPLKPSFPYLNIYTNNQRDEYKYSVFIPDVLNDGWLCISSSIILNEFRIEKNNPSVLNNIFCDAKSEAFKSLINTISDVTFTSNANDSDLTIFQYGNPLFFDTFKCISSKDYPFWNNKLIKDCFIPGSNEDTPATIKNIINDLYYNYPALHPGQFAVSTYQIQNINYIAIVKVDLDYTIYPRNNNKLVIKCKIINLDNYCEHIEFTKDLKIRGSLNVTTYDNKDIIKTDNVKKIVCFNDKIGINEQPYQVKALLDIDNLSKPFLSYVLNLFSPLQNYTYESVNELIKQNTSILNSVDVLKNVINTNIDLRSYSDQIIVFKSPIQNIIDKTDLTWLYVPEYTYENGPFSSKNITDSTFKRISQIINEINKMNTDLELLDKLTSIKKDTFIFSFIELLSDTTNYQMVSMKGFIKNNEFYFVMIPLNVNKIMINPSYTEKFSNITNIISGLNRMINYSVIVANLPIVLKGLLEGDSVNSFTKYFDNSPYFRDRFGIAKYSYVSASNLDVAFFVESNPHWNLKPLSSLYLPNTDKSLKEVNEIIYKQYQYNYNLTSVNQNFLIEYIFNKQEKISIANQITLNGTQYMIISGLNLVDIIDNSISSKGDVESTGQLFVYDAIDQPVFKVDPLQKKITLKYNTGIGTDNPSTTLDLVDCGLLDINKIINDFAGCFNVANTNIQLLKNATLSNDVSIASIIENDFIDPVTQTNLEQSKDRYVIVYSNLNMDENNTFINYNWLYSNWNNTFIKNIIDPNNEIPIENLKKQLKNLIDNHAIYENSAEISTFDWTFGKKVAYQRTFTLNDQLYTLGIGLNIQDFNLKYNNNPNIQRFFNYLVAYSTYMDNIVERLNNIQPNNIFNYDIAEVQRKLFLQQYPIQFCKKYVIDWKFLYDSIISDFDVNTLEESNTIDYNSLTDTNLKNRFVLMVNNLLKRYPNTNDTMFSVGDYGVITFEDNYHDFISYFYCSDAVYIPGEQIKITLISLEIQTNTIIIPSVSVNGDVKISGDTYFNDYAFIDTEKRFLGLNSTETNTNYYANIVNTSGSRFNLAAQNMLVKSNTYPNFVGERNTINEYYNDQLNIGFFVPVASMTCRRTSSSLTFNDMNDYSIYTTGFNNKYTAPYANQGKDASGNLTFYKYGASISYEVKDNTNYTNILGRSFMCIDSVSNIYEPILEKNITTTNGAFGVQVLDFYPNSNYRNIMYVDNNGLMYVNKVVLGNDASNILEVDANNNLLFRGRKVAFES
jgi:hypothetical protein